MRNKYRIPLSLLLVIVVLGIFGGCTGTTPPLAQPTRTPYTVPYISPDLDKARETLQTFFAALHDGRYAEAVQYYGGDYGVLRDWNPEVSADDFARLLERGCTINGLQCLAIQTVDPGTELPAGGYQFSVGFAAADGSVFTRGTERQFSYTVRKVDGKFLVQELPVYVP